MILYLFFKVTSDLKLNCQLHAFTTINVKHPH